MSHDCFVCLSKAKNKVCNTCECYAHPRCWGKYLEETSNVLTYIYQERCRGNIRNVKTVTRSNTKFARRTCFARQLNRMLVEVEILQDNDQREVIFSNIFKIISRNKILIRGDERFKNIIRENLIFLYKEQKWKSANLYYHKIFGEQIM
jgi:UDP-N-acetylenolpyruvoylglucosamine reductase